MATQPNFQPPPIGFGSYLKDILPNDVAVAAGAFATAVQQVSNIKNTEFEKFAQVVAATEVTNTNLNLINGTDVPVNLAKTAEDTIITALGSGPHGTYVASDFFGCMSGLPYNWRELQASILAAQTTKLRNIYQELFLAVTWDPLDVSVIVETRQVLIDAGPPPVYQTEYRVGGFAIVNKGGGYGRGTAPDVIITCSNGGSGLGIVGRNVADPGSVGTGTYGRIISVTVTSKGSWELSPPTVVSIQHPPTATLAVQPSGAKATGGSNTSYGTVGWASPMNTVVQAYINQANTEIQAIKASKSALVKKLNAHWDYNGKQLEIEQRCRYQALDPVPIPRSRWISTYPTTISTFVDAMATYAQSTRPHMYAQTLEAISNLGTVCGQSAVGLMRQERNSERIEKISVPIDNSIPGKIAEELEKPLIANGTLPVGKKGSGIEVAGVNGNKLDPVTTYTAPSALVQQLPAPATVAMPVGAEGTSLIAPKPQGYFDTNRNKFIAVNKTTPLPGTPGTVRAPGAANTSEVPGTGVNNILAVEKLSANQNINLLGPAGDGTGPARPLPGAAAFDPGSIQGGVTDTSLSVLSTNATVPALGMTPQGLVPLTENNTYGAVPPGITVTGLNGNDPASLYGTNIIPIEPIAVVTVGATVPTGDGVPLDDGSATYPGSLAGSPETNLIPPALNTAYTASVLLPSTMSVAEAIDHVVECNCECWVD